MKLSVDVDENHSNRQPANRRMGMPGGKNFLARFRKNFPQKFPSRE